MIDSTTPTAARPAGSTIRMVSRILVLAQAVAAAKVLDRLSRGRHRHDRLRAAKSPARGRIVRPTISVIVPARDEEHRIAACLGPLGGDPDVTEVLVVDDRSTDGTAALARSLGARVIEGSEPRAGWVGKSWALQQALEAASGQVVVCLDADTRPQPGLAMALAQVLAMDADFVSAAPRFDVRTPGERLLHPSLLASLLYRFGPGDARERPPRASRLVANGQCMAALRVRLLEAGGFVHCRDRFTDDAALARALAARGWRVAFRDGSELLTVRMHQSAAEVWREWGRTIGFADVSSRPELAADVALVWLTMALPVLRAATGRAGRLDRALLGVRWLLLAGLRGSYSKRGAAFWLSPLADPVSALRLTSSAWRQPRSWKGRSYAPR